MLRQILVILLLLFFQASYAVDSKNVEIQTTRIERIDNAYRCKLKLIVHGGWKIYGNVKFSSPSCDEITFEDGRKVEDSVYKSVIIIPDTGATQINLKAEFPACSDKMCVFVNKDFQIDFAQADGTDEGMLYIMLLAFLGGLILNFMPCVLPVLSLKMHSIISRPKNRKHMLYTWCGIQISFILFTIFIASLKALGHTVGWGMHFQNVYFLNIATLLVFLFILCIYGRIDIFVSTTGTQKVHSKSEIFEDIYSGILATILAIPCTAPFLGTAAAVALNGSLIKLVTIFLTIGFGFGAPYLLLYFCKININIKQGKWMNTLKYIMGIGIVATFIWLCWLLSNHLNLCQMLLLGACYLAIILFSRKMLILALFCIIACCVPSFMSECTNINSLKSVGDRSMWKKFDPLQLQNYVNDNKVVFVNVTADWCMTCKYNKSVLLSTDNFHNLVNKYGVICMEGDLTYNNEIVALFLKLHNQSGIPFNVVFGPRAKSGIKLGVIPSIAEVEQAINEAQGE